MWRTTLDDNGDAHVTPAHEWHELSSNCSCVPDVEVVGDKLFYRHYSQEQRDVIAEATAIIAGL